MYAIYSILYKYITSFPVLIVHALRVTPFTYVIAYNTMYLVIAQKTEQNCLIFPPDIP